MRYRGPNDCPGVRWLMAPAGKVPRAAPAGGGVEARVGLSASGNIPVGSVGAAGGTWIVLVWPEASARWSALTG